MHKPRRLRAAVVLTSLAVATIAGIGNPANAEPVRQPGQEAGLATVPGNAAQANGPDAHEKAAADNNAADRAATKDRSKSTDKPVVPQKPGVPTTGATEAAGQDGGLAQTTAPAGPSERSPQGRGETRRPDVTAGPSERSPQGRGETRRPDVTAVSDPMRLASPAMVGNDGNSCIFSTIEDAISISPAGSTIYVAPGTYPAVTAHIDYNIDKNLDIVKGTTDCKPTTGGSSTDVILQRNAASTADAVVEVYGSAVVRFDRITIEGGNSAEGTLYVSGSAHVTLDDSIVRNGTNPSTTVGGGGVRVSGASAQLTSINDSQIENNKADLGGGIYVDDGTVTINGVDNVELNNADFNGGGIYAVNNASVVLSNNADVWHNAATFRGGGVYLTTASTLSMTGVGTSVGGNLQANTASSGAGVFAEGGATVTVGGSAAVQRNSAAYGGGIFGRGAGTIVRIDQDGSVASNSASVNGGGLYVDQSAVADFNAGAAITGNSASSAGGGIAVISPATLDADGGTPIVDPVVISGNSAGTDGGGIYSTGTSNLDTVHIANNAATQEGGGAYITNTGSVTVTESFSCGPASLTKEHYCNEFRGNTAGTTGGAVHAAGGDFAAVQTAFIGNSADNAAMLMATGDSDISIRAALAIQNTETVAAIDALVTGHDTSSITLVGVTFAAQTESFLDTDDTATATVSRVLTTTGTLGLIATPAGACNISAVAADLPGLLVTPVQFTSTSRTDYMPVANAPGLDRCPLLGGHSADIDDTAVIDVPPASVNDYDVGAFEAIA